MVKKCDEGYILRRGYTRPGYKKCPPRKKGCKEEEKIAIKKKYIKPTCVPDKGEPGKTPKNKQWAPKVERNFLSQYFPERKMAYDMKSCIQAGLEASKRKDVDYQEFSSRFNYVIGLNKNRPNYAIKMEKCRQAALIGFDPNKNPRSKAHPEANINLKQARLLRDLLAEVKSGVKGGTIIAEKRPYTDLQWTQAIHAFTDALVDAPTYDRIQKVAKVPKWSYEFAKFFGHDPLLEQGASKDPEYAILYKENVIQKSGRVTRKIK